jgi:hypothetical protein
VAEYSAHLAALVIVVDVPPSISFGADGAFPTLTSQ